MSSKPNSPTTNSPITPDEWLGLSVTERCKAWCTADPEAEQLRRTLLVLGGNEIVTPFLPELDTGPNPMVLPTDMLKHGAVVPKDVMIIIQGDRNACHANAAELWVTKEYGCSGIGTGWGLSNDGLWREHSWGMNRNGIIETTEPRTVYFGMTLSGQDANKFAAQFIEGFNPTPQEAKEPSR